MPNFTLKLKNRKIVADDTMALFFEKPKDFTFKPGQFGDFSLPNPPETDGEGNGRAFTIASPPSSDQIMVTTRLRNTAFKRSIQKVPLGTEFALEAPLGSFTLHHNQATPAVFISGGIGITPARSVILQTIHDKLNYKIYLFYSNHTPETTAFLEEFQALQKGNPNFKFIPIMTSMGKSKKSWSGETEHINCKMLSKYIEDITKPIYYISGPPAMVAGMQTTLTDCGIDPDTIRSEEFPGY